MPLFRLSQSINWILLLQVKGLLFFIQFVNRLQVGRYMKDILHRPESYELSGMNYLSSFHFYKKINTEMAKADAINSGFDVGFPSFLVCSKK